jgi:hypothetical protein
MASRDKVLADMFAEEFKDRFAWRKEEHPGGQFCWHWKPTPEVNWRALSDDKIPRERLREYARLGGLDVTPEQLTEDGLTRILELAKKPLRVEPPDTHPRQIL